MSSSLLSDSCSAAGHFIIKMSHFVLKIKRNHLFSILDTSPFYIVFLSCLRDDASPSSFEFPPFSHFILSTILLPPSLSSFSSLLRAPAPASHQHQHLGSARRVKAQGGLGGYHPPYMCVVCVHVCVFMRKPRCPQTLLFIISNNFFSRLPRYLAPLVPDPYLPWCCVQL